MRVLEVSWVPSTPEAELQENLKNSGWSMSRCGVHGSCLRM